MTLSGFNLLFSKAVLVLGLAISALGALIFLGQAIGWLKFGEWKEVTVLTALRETGLPELYLKQRLVGLQMIIDWIIHTIHEMPASAALMLIGILIALPSIKELSGSDAT
jgi:hypothetical protein